jgi:hypothetical protein
MLTLTLTPRQCGALGNVAQIMCGSWFERSAGGNRTSAATPDEVLDDEGEEKCATRRQA